MKTTNKYNTSYVYPDHFYAPEDEDCFTLHIDGWSRLLNNYKGMENLSFLELGTQYGRASVFLLESILTGDGCHLDTVDILDVRKTNAGGEVDIRKNLAPYVDAGRCTFHCNNTNDFFKSNTKSYDLVYIDASHEREDVLTDAINAFYSLAPEGVIILDDYGYAECGTGIDAFLNVFSRKIDVLQKSWQVVVKKKAVLEFRPEYVLEGHWAL